MSGPDSATRSSRRPGGAGRDVRSRLSRARASLDPPLAGLDGGRRHKQVEISKRGSPRHDPDPRDFHFPRRQPGGTVPSWARTQAGRRSARTMRRRAVAVAAVVLVGGVLVTPALGIGSRLLDRIQSPTGPPEVRLLPGRPTAADRLHEPARRQLRGLRHERERERAAELDAQPGIRRRSAWSRDGRKIAFVSNRNGNYGV